MKSVFLKYTLTSATPLLFAGSMALTAVRKPREMDVRSGQPFSERPLQNCYSCRM
jgi:hypothetical protein